MSDIYVKSAPDHQTGIIEDHDDDVMDEQKWSTCSWLLFVELAKRQAALEEEVAESGPPRKSEQHVQHHTSSAEDSASASASASESASAKVELAATDPSLDELVDVDGQDVCNPHLTWGEARQVMTRPDFITELDHLNIIFIDRHHHIRADSMPLLRAFRRLAETEGYEDKLERVM